jgi:hypothetical protein
MRSLRNTNERFGDTTAIYEAASREALADEMAPMLATWAGEAAEQTGEAVEDAVQRLRGEFIDDLEEVQHAS